jgi:2-polyprenyl-6-hydroxyphenyl methylase/3-demethylubiquinone-9 3-methyltransferase
MHSDHSQEVACGRRFAFGKNWRRFLATVSAERVSGAEQALSGMLGDIRGRTFLDVGCGAGLSSLAAHRLGADVQGFDFDPESVACATELQRRFGCSWPVQEGSALDVSFLRRLGTFDIVYSWGVLHHTGAMWQALENMVSLVRPNGTLFISIYNDQGWTSKAWKSVKQLYNRSDLLKPVIVAAAFVLLRVPAVARDTFTLGNPLATLTGRKRGMSSWHDLLDWVGGYPFEVASPEDIFRFYRDRGLSLQELKTCGGGLGCNEYVFLRGDSRPQRRHGC